MPKCRCSRRKKKQKNKTIQKGKIRCFSKVIFIEHYNFFNKELKTGEGKNETRMKVNFCFRTL